MAKTKKEETVVVSFRLTKGQHQILVDEMKANPVVGIKSHHDYARKLVVDRGQKRLLYLNKGDETSNPNLAPS